MAINRIKYVNVGSQMEESDFVKFSSGKYYVFGTLTATQNGIYLPEEGVDAYNRVVVDVKFPPMIELEYVTAASTKALAKKNGQPIVEIESDTKAIGYFGLTGAYAYCNNIYTTQGNTLNWDNIIAVLEAGLYETFYWTTLSFSTVSMNLIAENVRQEAMRKMFARSNIQHVVLSTRPYLRLIHMGCCAYMFLNSTLKTFSSRIGRIGNDTDTLAESILSENAAGCAEGMFWDTDLTNIEMSDLTYIFGNRAAAFMFRACSKLQTASFPALTIISRPNAGSNMFLDCGNLESISCPLLKTISGTEALLGAFGNCVKLSSGGLNAVNKISGTQAMRETYNGCSALANISLESVQSIEGDQAMLGTYNNCTSLITANFKSLRKIYAKQVFDQTFKGCTALTDIYFPAIHDLEYVSLFYSMCTGLENITIHFPSNMQSTIEQSTGYSTTAPYGAISGTILFDLPSTATLTGADGNVYYRNPLGDTNEYLAWGLMGSDELVDTNTVFYTATTSDPQVGANIYEDSSLSTIKTTVASIEQ